MDIRETIQMPIKSELLSFKQYYARQFKSAVPLLDSALEHVGASVGKMMRPMLLLLVAKSYGEINDKSYASATALELLHTASLLHDDVVDESHIRRGVPSLNAVYSNRIAILTGDYLFSSSLYNAALTQRSDIIEGLSQLGRILSSGEMMQLELQQNGGFSEEKYLRVIECKTASLFACCARFGALSVDAAPSAVERMEQFGRLLGICFQIKDHIFDYYNSDIGKPTGSDMREGKITLPALYVLAHSKTAEASAINDKLQNGISLDENEISTLIELSKNEGGVEYALRVIERYKEQALSLLVDDIPQECRAALVAYLHYAVSRDK
ncbi:MAG: polyprenyl synthetase family protein [Bacteroidaceae bacterium]|nr:polyprenyl synthetase family protein [Bacteroidaceae bacterium]